MRASRAIQLLHLRLRSRPSEPFGQPAGRRFPLTDSSSLVLFSSRGLAPRSSLLSELPSPLTGRTLTANYDVPREYNNSHGEGRGGSGRIFFPVTQRREKATVSCREY